MAQGSSCMSFVGGGVGHSDKRALNVASSKQTSSAFARCRSKFRTLVCSAKDGQSTDSRNGDEGGKSGFGAASGGGGLAGLRQAVSGIGQLFGLTGPRNRYASLLEFDPSSSRSDFDDEDEPPVVLVVGATGATGRVVVRKLLLRGFQVRVMVRNLYSSTLDLLPTAVSFVKADVTDSVYSLQDALSGVDKIVCLLGARDDEDRYAVEAQGVSNLIQGFHNVRVQEFGPSESTKVSLFKFSKPGAIERWKTASDEVGARLASAGLVARPPRTSFFLNANQNAVFVGKVFDKYSGVAEAFVRPDRCNLRGYSGIILRVLGDGKSYRFAISTLESEPVDVVFTATFETVKNKWSTVRIPFSKFVPSTRRQIAARTRGAPELRRSNISQLGIMYSKPVDRPEADDGDYYLAIDYIKAYRTQEEPDFVFLSSAELSRSKLGRELQQSGAVTGSAKLALDSIAAETTEQLSGASTATLNLNAVDARVLAKWRAEQSLRLSGLTYCIIRAGELTDEEGGKRPLVLGQDDNTGLSESPNQSIGRISRADIAEICVRSLLDPRACNLTFDACEGNFAPTSMVPTRDLSLLFERLKPNT
mmetsp:Transcript_58/g.93  ORF Transcript_58/g.93 Transcript_58/m.93 type:complete len:590 (+) Transcript_58:93-1862(+)